MTRAVTVSDHAVVRWLERARGFDVDAIRAEIARICLPAAEVGCRKLSVGGLTYMLEGFKVTTISPSATPAVANIEGIKAHGVTPAKGPDKGERLKVLRREGRAYLRGRPL